MDKTMTVKITTLTYSNIDALHVAVRESGILQPRDVTLGKTIATFHTDERTALALVNSAIDTLAQSYGRRGHPVQSLQAVRRKLERAVDALPKITAAPTIVIVPDK
jgi:hypothetical protein